MRVRRIPVETEAVQWTGRNTEEMSEFVSEYRIDAGRGGIAMVRSGGGWIECPVSHWIVRDPDEPLVFTVQSDYRMRAKYEFL